MRPMPKLFLCLAVLLFGTLAGTAGRAAELTLDGSTRYTIPAEINGQPLRLRVDIAASGYIVLNPDAARRAGLEGSMVRARTLVGPYRLTGGSNAVRIDLAGIQLRERIGWFDRNVVEGAEGVISPEILPYEAVTFRLAPERPDDRVTQAALSFTKGGGLFLPYETAGRTVGVRFSTLEPRSLATAAAGALISGEQGSRWAGEPEEAVISFGISRPVREMRLDRPAPPCRPGGRPVLGPHRRPSRQLCAADRSVGRSRRDPGHRAAT